MYQCRQLNGSFLVFWALRPPHYNRNPYGILINVINVDYMGSLAW